MTSPPATMTIQSQLSPSKGTVFWKWMANTPFIMLADDGKFPLTVGLYTLLVTGANQPALHNLVITGALLSIIPLIALFLTMQSTGALTCPAGL